MTNQPGGFPDFDPAMDEYVDLDTEAYSDPDSGKRFTNADAERLADEAERLGPPIGRPRLGAGPTTGPSPVVRYRVPDEVKARLEAVAGQQHRKPNEVARRALLEYLARHPAG